MSANMANDDANKNHNPNYPNLYEFANNTNKNKLKTQKSKFKVSA